MLLPIFKTEAKITECINITDNILKVMLMPMQYVDYIAGQYLHIICDDDDFICYSIANAPADVQQYELQL